MSGSGQDSWPGEKIVVIVLVCLTAAGVGGWLHSSKVEVAERNEKVKELQANLENKAGEFESKWNKLVVSVLDDIGPGLLRRPAVKLGEIGDYPLVDVVAMFLAGETTDWKEKLGRNGIQVMDMLLAIDELPAVGADYGIIVKKDGSIAFRTAKVTSSGLAAAKDVAEKLGSGKLDEMVQRWISGGEGSIDLVAQIPVKKGDEVIGGLVTGVMISDELLSKWYKEPDAALFFGGRLVASTGPVCIKAVQGEEGGLEKAAKERKSSRGFSGGVAFITKPIKGDEKKPDVVYALCAELKVPEGGFAAYITKYYWYGGAALAIVLSALVAFLAHRKEDEDAIEEEADSDMGGWGNQ